MLANGWKAVEDRCWCWLTDGGSGRPVLVQANGWKTGVGAG